MDKNSKILISVFFVLIFLAVGFSFYNYMITKNYYTKAETSCDPATEKCFVTVCDPATDSECPKDPADQTTYTKLIEKKAYNMPTCDPNSTDCPPLTCAPNEDCQEFFCDETTVSDGQACSDPATYLKDQKKDEASTSSTETNLEPIEIPPVIPLDNQNATN